MNLYLARKHFFAWAVRSQIEGDGSRYDQLIWDARDGDKPSEAQCRAWWLRVPLEARVEAVREQRRGRIVEAWPVERQLEAIAEYIEGRPLRMNELQTFLAQVKAELPKPVE